MTGPTVRRPVPESEPEDTSGRRGCIVAGAALGVVAGVLFAFFLLPPLLHHYFGETEVRMGAVYSAGGKTIRVVSVHAIGGEGYEVQLEVKTKDAWAPAADDFQFELAAQSVRVTAEPASSSLQDSGMTFAPGDDRMLVLRFPLVQAGQPTALHLSNPRLRFLLTPASQP